MFVHFLEGRSVKFGLFVQLELCPLGAVVRRSEREVANGISGQDFLNGVPEEARQGPGHGAWGNPKPNHWGGSGTL